LGFSWVPFGRLWSLLCAPWGRVLAFWSVLGRVSVSLLLLGTPWISHGIHLVTFCSFFAFPGTGFWHSGVCLAIFRCPSDFLPLSLILGPHWLDASSKISAFALPRPLQLRSCLPWFRPMALLHVPVRRRLLDMSLHLPPGLGCAGRCATGATWLLHGAAGTCFCVSSF
jgi:hypothetical protein